MKPVYLLRGDDEALLREAARDLVDRLVGDADRFLMVDEHAGEDEDLVAVLADAAATPPLFTEHRVVVGRDLARFTRADDVAPLVAVLGDPLPTTALVLVWGSGRVPKPLLDAVAAAGGEVLDTSAGRRPGDWVQRRLREAPVVLDGSARALVAEHLGEDAARLAGLVASLESAYGPGARLGVEEVEPFLGQAGGIPPWELTDAIDSGKIAEAVDNARRLLGGGERHPLAVLAVLGGHYSRILRLDGAMAADERQAASLLGMKGSTFPAKKALTQARRLGHDRVVRAIGLVAGADLALRGALGWPPELVVEVLVARLAGLSRR